MAHPFLCEETQLCREEKERKGFGSLNEVAMAMLRENQSLGYPCYKRPENYSR